MDDLKIHKESQVELEFTLEVVDELAGAVGMSLGGEEVCSSEKPTKGSSVLQHQDPPEISSNVEGPCS